jgi:sec-independent protein translocase protein TatA
VSSIGAPELLILLLIVILVFGASRLPKLARSLGEAKRELDTTRPSPDEPA